MSASSDRSGKDVERMRDASRREYLQKREAKRIRQLEESIREEEEAFGGELLTDREKRILEQKRQMLDLVKKRFMLEESARSEFKNEDLSTKQPDWEEEKLKHASIQKTLQQEYEFVFDSTADDFKANEETEEEKLAEEKDELEAIGSSHTKLPIHSYKAELVQAIRDNQVVIIVGETGSGKTTQLPQFLHEAGFTEKGIVCCTQPRRVAAMSVARRVSEETGTKLGDQVGYAVRFEECFSPSKTRIKYMTDGMLLRDFHREPDLSSYSCIIVDEAHERTLHTDILLGLLKDICRSRPEFRLIVSSATMNAEQFSEFFDSAPVLRVPGRKFPVQIYYTKEPVSDPLDAVVRTIIQIHLSQGEGDILVFLAGQDEIETVQEMLAGINLHGLPALLTLPCFASLPVEQQTLIFSPTPKGSRKVVLATNIAETSITIDGIAFVINPGFQKVKTFNPSTGMESLSLQPCSQASAIQRTGRAGRTGPGKCFRLFTRWTFEHELPPSNTPEIQRTNLGSVILSLKSIGVDDLVSFDFLDPPSPSALIQALNTLYAMGALSQTGQLTVTGKKMAAFPTDPMLARMLVASVQYECTEEALSVAAMLQIQNNLFHIPFKKKKEAERSRSSLGHPLGDHLTLLHVWNQWKEAKFSSQWCFDHFVQVRSLQRAKSIRDQLSRILARLQSQSQSIIEASPPSRSLQSAQDPTVSIRKAILSGFFPNTARLSPTGDSYRLAKNPNQAVWIHPSSILRLFSNEKEKKEKKEKNQQKPPALLVYHELVQTTREFLRQVTAVEPEWLDEIAPHFFPPSRRPRKHS